MAATHAALTTAGHPHRSAVLRGSAAAAVVPALSTGAVVPAGAADRRGRASPYFCLGIVQGITGTGRLAAQAVMKDSRSVSVDTASHDSATGLGFTPVALAQTELRLTDTQFVLRNLAVTPGGRLYRITSTAVPSDPTRGSADTRTTVARTLLRTDWRGTRAVVASWNEDSLGAERARYVYRVSGSTLRRYELSSGGAPINGKVLSSSFASTKTLSLVEGTAKADTLVATTTDGRLVQHRITTSRTAPVRTTSTLRTSGFSKFESVNAVPCMDDAGRTVGTSIPRYYYAVTPDKRSYLYKDPNSADRTGAGWGGGSLRRTVPLARTY